MRSVQGVVQQIRSRGADFFASEGSRSLQRYKKIGLASIGSGFANGITALSGFILVPLTLGYLGDERYGIWITLNSLIQFLSFSDLGIGNGIVNAVSEADGKDDPDLARRYISSAYFILSIVSAVLLLVLAFGFSRVNWVSVLDITNPADLDEAKLSVLIFLLCYVFNIPFGLGQKIYIGLQDGFSANVWKSISSIASFIFMVVCINLRTGIPGLVVASAGIPLIVTAIMNFFMFTKKLKHLRPHFSLIDRSATTYILKTGAMFLVLQIAGALAFQSANLIIYKMLGAANVTQFSIPQKLFSIIPTILGFFIAPLWPAYGEAIARKDYEWVRKTFVRSIKIGVWVNIPTSVFLIIFGPWIIRLWVGNDVKTPLIFLVLLGITNVVNIVNGPLAMLLNGAGIIGFQAVTASVMGIGNILLSIYLVPRYGYIGVTIASIVSLVVCNIVPTFIYIRKINFFRQ